MAQNVTVAELIKKLQTLPQDYTITFDKSYIDLEYSIDVLDGWKEVDFH